MKKKKTSKDISERDEIKHPALIGPGAEKKNKRNE